MKKGGNPNRKIALNTLSEYRSSHKSYLRESIFKMRKTNQLLLIPGMISLLGSADNSLQTDVVYIVSVKYKTLSHEQN
jgi:hypothetical protein